MKAENDRLVECLKRGSVKRTSNTTFPNLKVEHNVAPTSNTLSGSVFAKRDIRTDHKWRKDSAESTATIEQIERKAASIGPAFNKGSLQYIVNETPEQIAAGRRR